MIIDDGATVRLAIPRLYSGPAGMRDGVMTFRAEKAEGTFSGTVDDRPCRIRVWPIADYRRRDNPFLQASVIPA